ncbi:hypothetical protein [Streptacidiphilus sp. MAP12-16]
MGGWICGACGVFGDVLPAEALALFVGMAGVRRSGRLGGER